MDTRGYVIAKWERGSSTADCSKRIVDACSETSIATSPHSRTGSPSVSPQNADWPARRPVAGVSWGIRIRLLFARAKACTLFAGTHELTATGYPQGHGRVPGGRPGRSPAVRSPQADFVHGCGGLARPQPDVVHHRPAR